jgi:flagellar hook-basal body complex protein FliE
MAIAGVGAMGVSQLAQLYQQQVTAGTPVGGDSTAARAAGTRGTEFTQAIGDGLQQLETLDRTAATKATEAATGSLRDVSDYVIAATQAQTATELTTTVRNKALDAFNEIMRMPL